jgi:hypothetical protein
MCLRGVQLKGVKLLCNFVSLVGSCNCLINFELQLRILFLHHFAVHYYRLGKSLVLDFEVLDITLIFIACTLPRFFNLCVLALKLFEVVFGEFGVFLFPFFVDFLDTLCQEFLVQVLDALVDIVRHIAFVALTIAVLVGVVLHAASVRIRVLQLLKCFIQLENLLAKGIIDVDNESTSCNFEPVHILVVLRNLVISDQQ